jgi:hypothetical protein
MLPRGRQKDEENKKKGKEGKRKKRKKTKKGKRKNHVHASLAPKRHVM